MAPSRLGRLEGQKPGIARHVLAFRDSHVAVLNDRSAVFIQHMLLARFAKCGPAGKHHICCLVQRSCSVLAILNIGVLLIETAPLAVYVTIRWAAVMIVVEYDRARILYDHFFAVAVNLLVSCEHSRTELMYKAACLTLGIPNAPSAFET